ncbi:keratinocyte differentiation factor 1 [Esox lucius]|uniref:Keratinocyte differentiation factor 1a n=1 Tax=Esox lucius TaxID=8010 RepID=A0A3P9AGA6_ESOLU|nr:keratinocyte differentiation factor 1 [Esox lucius]XP_010883697.2 keratinocyte differentiation factor 1 [Esox lucius]
MPGHSTGAPQKSRHQIQQSGHSRTNGYRQGRSIPRDSTAGQESYKDPHPNTGTREQKRGKHPRLTEGRPSGRGVPPSRHVNGRGSETLGFIPGSADSPQGTQACGSCTSIGWSGCRALLCCVLTCGICSTRKPCLPANDETSTDQPGKAVQEQPRPPNGTAGSNPSGGVPLQPRQPSKLPPSDSFRYEDVRIAGQTVVYPAPSSGPRRAKAGVKGDSQRPVSNTSTIYSREDLDLDELSDSKTNIDSLITKKLLELYALHQIDQLAKCTSDSSFSRKTNDISELICSIAHDYNLEQKEAECRLVHGVIRISTRKGKKNHNSQDPVHQRTNGRSDGGTLPDSGNETMTFPFDSSEMEPEVKVSELTSSDELARKMWHHSGKPYYSSSTTAYSPYLHDTENDSSGAPLLHIV